MFDAVAIKEPAITVKVISAMFVEKYFMPKKEEVKAAVMVGQAPYDTPVKHKPATHKGREPTDTANRVTAAAQMVRILAYSIVLRRPMASKSAPVRIRPRPLQIDKIPTRDTARASDAFTDNAKSLAKLITELPTAAKKEMHTKAIQKEGRQSICAEVRSCRSKVSAPAALAAFPASIKHSGKSPASRRANTEAIETFNLIYI